MVQKTLLIDVKCIKSHTVPIIRELISFGCEIVVDKKINKLFKKIDSNLQKKLIGKQKYLKPKIAIKAVNGVQEAIQHILKYGTMHTDSIVTNNRKTAKIFLNEINSDSDA